MDRIKMETPGARMEKPTTTDPATMWPTRTRRAEICSSEATSRAKADSNLLRARHEYPHRHRNT
jgi:hypothetical protein